MVQQEETDIVFYYSDVAVVAHGLEFMKRHIRGFWSQRNISLPRVSRRLHKSNWNGPNS